MDGILLDPLQVKDSAGTTVNPATQDTLDLIKSAVEAIASARGAVADIRVTMISGGTVSAVTTVTTVTGITNIGGYSAARIVNDIGNANAVLSNINNIGRS